MNPLIQSARAYDGERLDDEADHLHQVGAP